MIVNYKESINDYVIQYSWLALTLSYAAYLYIEHTVRNTAGTTVDTIQLYYLFLISPHINIKTFLNMTVTKCTFCNKALFCENNCDNSL